jgi:hypothetical protein
VLECLKALLLALVVASAPPSNAAHLATEAGRLLQGLLQDVPFLQSCPPFIRAEAAKVGCGARCACCTVLSHFLTSPASAICA